MKQPLSARLALGQAQISSLELEYQSVINDPKVSAHGQMLFGWLETILEVGTSQELWHRSVQRATAELEALRGRTSASWALPKATQQGPFQL